jgi:hypothetical protein
MQSLSFWIVRNWMLLRRRRWSRRWRIEDALKMEE